MSAVIEHKEPELPAPVVRHGINESQWRALCNLFPGARGESVLLVWHYCQTRKLDPFKKPCHIVPMYVGGAYRDVILPGIYEYRTTAIRTKEYMGQGKPVFGPVIDYKGVRAPEFCEITVYRWNQLAGQRCEFTGVARFEEYAALKFDKESKTHVVNERWTRAPQQMIEKCAEAAALRKAFPDELGGEPTFEEMEGQHEREPIDVTPRPDVNPRGDLSGVDWELRDQHVSAFADILSEYGSDENVCGEKVREYIAANLAGMNELYITVYDELAKRGIISKANFRKYADPVQPRQRS